MVCRPTSSNLSSRVARLGVADPAGVVRPVHVAESAVIDAVLDLLAEAILADVMAISRDDGLVPEGTEPSGAAVSEHHDDVAGIPCPPEAA